MADRNDALLLALGWEFEPGTAADNFPFWKSPIGKVYRANESCSLAQMGLLQLTPRPYDSVDDGIAICKERGWNWGLGTFIKKGGGRYYQGNVYPNFQTVGAKSDNTPAEALAEAISKAVTRKENSHD